MRTTNTMLTILALALSLGPGVIAREQPTAYQEILGHYEAARQALLHDKTDGVHEAARMIGERARALQDGFDPDAAAVTKERAAECRENLPTIVEAAGKLQQTATLAEAREAFQELSKGMIRYRQLIASPESVVVYCSMAEKIWMQPKGEIGNPYHGQSMATCGQIVSP